MPNIQLFDFHGSDVRITDERGEPWFVAADVCAVLGYKNTNDAVSRHCKSKGVVKCDTPGGSQLVTIIPERDVYRLIMRSKLPAAQEFEEWVVGEVLPAIRKTGSYGNDSMAESLDRQFKLEALKFLVDAFGDVLSPESMQVLAAHTSQLAFGQPVLPLPRLDGRMFTATDIANETGFSASMVGRVSTANGLKTEEHGMWILDKSRSSGKQIQNFLYNQKGRDKLVALLEEKRSKVIELPRT